jgi:dTDP-4-dehydrorhamnose reductase
MRRKVLVTGASGQLAAAIAATFRPDSDIVGLTHAALDVTDDGAVEERLMSERPAVVINCASYNDVDGAEEQPVRALEVNAFAVRALARAADRIGAVLIHYSSDFVFDGAASRPYVEGDEPNPQSVYAASKLLGEWFALEARLGFVLRVESLFGAAGSGRRSSLDTIVAAIRAGTAVRVFTDRTVSPAYVFDIAAATRALIGSGAAAGLYHCVNTGACSWLEIAAEAGRLLGREPRLVPITLESVALRASRPKFCALDNAKLRELGIAMPTWQDALARHLKPSA